jgi:hypothetical protein
MTLAEVHLLSAVLFYPQSPISGDSLLDTISAVVPVPYANTEINLVFVTAFPVPEEISLKACGKMAKAHPYPVLPITPLPFPGSSYKLCSITCSIIEVFNG